MPPFSKGHGLKPKDSAQNTHLATGMRPWGSHAGVHGAVGVGSQCWGVKETAASRIPRPKSRMRQYALGMSAPTCYAWPEGGVPVWFPDPTEFAVGSEVDKERTIPAHKVCQKGGLPVPEGCPGRRGSLGSGQDSMVFSGI